jgi:hypothetical protein
MQPVFESDGTVDIPDISGILGDGEIWYELVYGEAATPNR